MSAPSVERVVMYAVGVVIAIALAKGFIVPAVLHSLHGMTVALSKASQ